MISVLKAQAHRRMPWKNGGGVTVEIAIHPEGASVDDFDWRVSMATVASDGPFSIFSGIDRTLSVLEGDGIALDVEGRETTLTRQSAPLAFPADARCGARLIGSAITDLNVMTRRGQFTHGVERLTVNGTVQVKTGGNSAAFLFCAEGQIDLAVAPDAARLDKHDCAVLTDIGAMPIEIGGNGTAYLISLAAIR